QPPPPEPDRHVFVHPALQTQDLHVCLHFRSASSLSRAERLIRVTLSCGSPVSCPPWAEAYYGDSVALGLAALRRSRGCLSGPVHVEGLRSSLAPAHCRVCPAGRSRGRMADPREAGIRVSASFPAAVGHTHWDGSSSHPA